MVHRIIILAASFKAIYVKRQCNLSVVKLFLEESRGPSARFAQVIRVLFVVMKNRFCISRANCD